MHNLRDFRPDVRLAIEQLHRAGFDGEAYVLASALEGAYSSALEMVQAIAGAVRRVERTLGADAPREVRASFRRALEEVARVVVVLGASQRDPGDAGTLAPPDASPCSSS
ncbi:MAG TPA: hypothetical protein VF167_16895 [Longimicrobiaceae bacterium]